MMIETAKDRAKYYRNSWDTMLSKMQQPAQSMMIQEMVLKDYNKLESSVQRLVIKELNAQGVKIPGLNGKGHKPAPSGKELMMKGLKSEGIQIPQIPGFNTK